MYKPEAVSPGSPILRAFWRFEICRRLNTERRCSGHNGDETSLRLISPNLLSQSFCLDNRFSAQQLIFCAYNRLFARLIGFHEKPTIAQKDVFSGQSDFLKQKQDFTVCTTRFVAQGRPRLSCNRLRSPGRGVAI